ncbi:E3 ubiquitin-protein ligase RSL1-like [Andrographis paniculata]|uniref:E3 ubiquitin-protein ligase RSL1-like n=1 Tax=Andrographis paniculata TaxID=175694 RepID=UPI0021E6DA71|nr:E3 ubiquitin-protein ligase RSL1-like [Andrographis paniculata]
MFPAATRPLASVNCKFPDEAPEYFPIKLTDVFNWLVARLCSDFGSSVILILLYSAGTFFAITAPAWMLLRNSKRRRKVDESFSPTEVFEAEVNGESPEERIGAPIADDGTMDKAFQEYEIAVDNDASYAEEIQIHEALLASSSHNKEQKTFGKGLEDSSQQSFCEICLDNKENWQMYASDECSHSFCYGCTSRHIAAKIEENSKTIPCPAFHCKASLNSADCRLMIPDDILVQWDEHLCMSLIPESQKLYCPFIDCSTMLVNDGGGEIVREIKCPVCKRRFCGECCVPWHPEFTCKEVRKAQSKRGGGRDGERIVRKLARKKKWQRCPKCKMYVEKGEGCVHITCRCRYEFCYRCGSKWNDSHGNCRPKV